MSNVPGDRPIIEFVNLLYRRAPWDDSAEIHHAVRTWVANLTEDEAISLLTWASDYPSNPERFQPPPDWAEEVCDSAHYYAGLVAHRIGSSRIRELLEERLTHDRLRNSALLGLENVASPKSLPALRSLIVDSFPADSHYAYVGQLGGTLSAIGTPESRLLIQEMLNYHEPGSMAHESLSQSLAECKPSE